MAQPKHSSVGIREACETCGVRIDVSESERALDLIDEVRPLWEVLRTHHAAVSSFRDLNSDGVEAWDLRRAWYVRVIRDGGALVTATGEKGVAGYAVLSVEVGADDTFAVGSGIVEIISLAVAGDLQGQGVGSALMTAIESWTLSSGLDSLRVAVMSGNDRAASFYEGRRFVEAERVLYRRLR